MTHMLLDENCNFADEFVWCHSIQKIFYGVTHSKAIAGHLQDTNFWALGNIHQWKATLPTAMSSTWFLNVSMAALAVVAWAPTTMMMFQN